MGETLSTTLAIKEISRNSSPLRTVALISDATSYPYTVTETNVTSIACVNTSATNTLTVTLTFSDASTFVIAIPAGNTYQSEYELDVTSINRSGTTPSFNMELLRRVA